MAICRALQQNFSSAFREQRSALAWPSPGAFLVPSEREARQCLQKETLGTAPLPFFSVLRLCGSRQVVAPCRADERITQMHSLYPSLGVQKWSKITTKWCQFQNEKPTKTQQKTNTHNLHPKQHQTKTKRKREHGMTAPRAQRPCRRFWSLSGLCLEFFYNAFRERR